MATFDPNVFDPNVFDVGVPAVAPKIPTRLTKLSPPVMVRGMREFHGGSSFQFSGGSSSRKQYVSSAGNKHKPIKR